MRRSMGMPEQPPKERLKPSGVIADRKGMRVLPDLPTAILARLRGYVGGAYPSPLRGEAAELGYYPLQSASADEMAAIMAEMDKMIG